MQQKQPEQKKEKQPKNKDKKDYWVVVQRDHTFKKRNIFS
jgi:hypothetical protein